MIFKLIYHNILMDIFLYAIIFIIGTFFGSFFTLAVYRIPRKEDILIKHSYCPNCNHKLGFFDLFPVLSYIVLGGKCRYCGNKIRLRYLILEVLSGLTFLAFAVSVKINILNVNSIINIAFLLVYVSILFIIAGIDKENIKIEKDVLVFGYIVEAIYIIYQYTLGYFNVYQYVMYLILFILLLILTNISLKITLKEKYFIQNLYLSLYMIIFNGSKIFILTVILTLFSIAIYKILSKEKIKEIPIGFYLCISNILVIAMSNIIMNYMI